jgi:hypothetical protein
LTIGYLWNAFNKYSIFNGGTTMELIRKNFKLGFFHVLTAFIIAGIVLLGLQTEARASKGVAFLGGLVAGHVVSGAVHRSKVRTAAAVETANQPRSQTTYVQQPPAQSQPAPAHERTTKQRMDQLDKLAAGGYITPEEYKAKKKALLDSL